MHFNYYFVKKNYLAEIRTVISTFLFVHAFAIAYFMYDFNINYNPLLIMCCYILAGTMSTDILHPHCESCHWRKCAVVTDPPCPVISCHNVCGASYHECKALEHQELCLLEKVPCINIENGCPMVMRRSDMNEHLSVCPASVVCCTMEWCRWPMYSREHGTRVPFAPSSLRARCGQLDVALALRDQRTLDRARRCPRRSLVRTLRNRFTRRHPTVPLLVGGNPTFENPASGEGNPGEFEFSDSEDEDMEENSRAPWLTSQPPGLKKSILGELFGELPSKSAANGNVSNLDVEDIHCALCSQRSGHLKIEAAATESVNTAIDGHAPCPNGIPEDITGGILEPQIGYNTELAAITSVMDSVGSAVDDGQHASPNSTTDDRDNWIMESEAENGIKAPLVQSSAGNGKVSGPCSELSVPPTLHEVLSVDLELVTCARGSIHDPSVYSFVCAQLFRRDEFSRHFRDVHSVLHDALDHWLEVRCPLAHRGCTFSIHRKQPTGASIVFSPLLESIGLRRMDVATVSTGDESKFEKDASAIPTSTQLQQEFAKLPLSTPNKQVECAHGMLTSGNNGSVVFTAIGECKLKDEVAMAVKDCESKLNPISIPVQSRGEATSKGDGNTDASQSADETYTVKQEVGTVVEDRSGFKEGTPVMFTSREFNSTVCIQPRTSKEPTPDNAEETPPLSFSDLPYEMLARIASFLDPYSLCNLSLTCWLLRDVCHSLLRHRGIVVLEWQRNCSWKLPLWKVSHKVSLSLVVHILSAVALRVAFSLIVAGVKWQVV